MYPKGMTVGRIKDWWKKKRAKVRRIGKVVAIGVGIGFGLSLLPWWAAGSLGAVAGAVNPGGMVGPGSALPIGAVCPWAGVGVAVAAPVTIGGPEVPIRAAGAAGVAGVALHRGIFHPGAWGSTFLGGVGVGLVVGWRLFD